MLAATTEYDDLWWEQDGGSVSVIGLPDCSPAFDTVN